MANILIIDDSLTVRMYHKQILTKAGHQCDEAENGQEALERAEIKHYDLFVVDINMPILDGYSFVKKLREKRDINPVIMVSTEAETKDKKLAYENGASFYLIKPAKPKLLTTLSKILIKE